MYMDDWAAVDWPPLPQDYSEGAMLDVTTQKQFKLFELVLLDWQLTRMHEEKPLKRYLDYRELVRAEIWQRLGPILSEGKE